MSYEYVACQLDDAEGGEGAAEQQAEQRQGTEIGGSGGHVPGVLVLSEFTGAAQVRHGTLGHQGIVFLIHV